MRFVAIVTGVGAGGWLLAAAVQGPVAVPGEGLPAAALSPGALTQGAAAATPDRGPLGAVRLIDLKNGETCKVDRPDPEAKTFSAVPLGQGCAASPGFARIAYWRSTADGSLIMADSGGGTVLKFAPGDGVLYESVYPRNALITIVPARS